MLEDDLDDPFFRQLRLTAIPVVFETGLFGIFSLLFWLSAYVLARRGLHSRQYALLFILVLVMYASGAAHWAISFSSFVQLVKNPTHAARPSKARATGSLVCLGVNSLLSDLIVLWRVHLVWGRNIFLLIISSILFLGKVAVLVANLQRKAHFGLPACCLADTLSSVGSLLPFLVNVWATLLMLLKAMRVEIAKYIRGSKTWTSLTEKIMVLLVESGLIYCTAWGLFCSLSFANVGREITVSARIGMISELYALLRFGMTQIAGIYPTMVIVVICLWQGTVERRVQSVFVTSAPRFASRPASMLVTSPLQRIASGSIVLAAVDEAARAEHRRTSFHTIVVDVESLRRHSLAVHEEKSERSESV
ncbi:hypothetical protein K488DRAFT_88659 [Vararia minispora EC-137]|uniref:Uncharacterized protein n=1 Tax=Vararia minispora EC-137 TaxID=1314806 RepID=A0ACB8QCJ8_9AGAM|nr:hypothetical protein K488DRAFT_88659 [Vararia minispora EC-137]